MVIMLVTNPVEQKTISVRKYSRLPPRKQDIQAIAGWQISPRAQAAVILVLELLVWKGARLAVLFRSPYFISQDWKWEHELESKNRNRASNVKSPHLPSSRAAHEISAVKIKETPEVEALQKTLFADTLGKNYPNVGLCLFFTGENFFCLWFMTHSACAP